MENEITTVTQISTILDVLPWQKIETVAGFPTCFLGTIAWNRSTLPVINLQLIKGKEYTETTDETCILVLELMFDGEEIHIGAIANSAKEISSLKDDLIYLPKDFMQNYKSVSLEYISNNIKEFNPFCFG